MVEAFNHYPTIENPTEKERSIFVSSAGEKTFDLLEKAKISPDSFRLGEGSQMEQLSASNLEKYKDEINKSLEELPQYKERNTPERIEQARAFLSKVPFSQWVKEENIDPMLSDGAKSHNVAGVKGLTANSDKSFGLDEFVFMYYGGTPYTSYREAAILYDSNSMAEDSGNFLTKEDYARISIDNPEFSRDEITYEYLSNLLTVKDFLELHAELLTVNCENPEDFWLRYEEMDFWDDSLEDRYFYKMDYSTSKNRYANAEHQKSPAEVKLWGMLRRLMYWEAKMKPMEKEKMQKAVIGIAQIGDIDPSWCIDLDKISKEHNVRLVKTPSVSLGMQLTDSDPIIRRMIMQGLLK